MPAQLPPRTSTSFVDLSALLSTVSDDTLRVHPALRALMVECACWEAHLAEWHGRQPPKRHDDYDAWILEGRAMFDRRDVLRQTACSLLRPAGPLPAL